MRVEQEMYGKVITQQNVGVNLVLRDRESGPQGSKCCACGRVTQALSVWTCDSGMVNVDLRLRPSWIHGPHDASAHLHTGPFPRLYMAAAKTCQLQLTPSQVQVRRQQAFNTDSSHDNMS